VGSGGGRRREGSSKERMKEGKWFVRGDRGTSAKGERKKEGGQSAEGGGGEGSGGGRGIKMWGKRMRTGVPQVFGAAAESGSGWMGETRRV